MLSGHCSAEHALEELRIALQQLYNEGISKPTLEEIQEELFEPVVKYFPGCVIVIDGIDNTDASRVYPAALYFRKLREKVFVKVLFSTRDDLDLPANVPRINLANSPESPTSNDLDIQNYVDAKLKDLSGPGKLLADDSLKELVKSELLSNANGMYAFIRALATSVC